MSVFLGIVRSQGGPVNEFSQGKINATVQEMKEERDAVKELGLIS
jgi:malate dehydrogenase